MKQILFLLILATCINCVFAQTHIDTRKFIEVTGSAEREIQPDEITIEIVLKEYYDDKEKKTISLNSIDEKLKTILKDNNIDNSSLTLNEFSNNYWWYWWTYYRNNTTYKKVSLKLSNKTNFLELVKDLNKKWVETINVTNSTHKNITEFRKEIKKEAIKAAKEKAQYLLEAVDESIGRVLSIEEIQENNNFWYRPQNVMSNTVISNSNNDNNDAVSNVAKIKLRYEIKAKFEIK